jgi:hypothetical protein
MKSFFLWAQVLVPNLSSIPLLKHYPPTHKGLFRSLTFGRAREYSQITFILAPLFFSPTSFDTASTFTALHLESNGYFLLFLEDYKPNQNLELFPNSFKLVFQCMSHLLASGLFGMIF